MRGRRGNLRYEELALHRLLGRFQKGVPLLAAGGEITANPSKDPRPAQRAKAARDFLRHFHHGNVLLALVVGKGHERILQKSQITDIKKL